MIDFVKIPEERLKFLKKEKKFLEELQRFSNTKIKLNEEVYLEADDPLKLLRVKEVIKAIGRGFMPTDAMDLLDESYYFLSIDIKSYAGKSRNRLTTLKGRLIGTCGKTKKMIESFTDTKLAIYGKTISIIGRWEDVIMAREAIEMLLLGRMHSTVYKFLEKKR
ncbi:MAG: KH domain-containing protein [Candidatus Aenigmarchaeota archaeon]|nr:KH domain-containing protein [Candidatus Aenigmarchaeota archaeon]